MKKIFERFSEIHSVMKTEDAVMAYAGHFDQEVIKSILKYAEDKLESSGIDELVKRKIFNVMVEMLQNITKHQYIENEPLAKPIFLLLEKTEYYLLVTGNLIEKSKIKDVWAKIDKINQMNPDELKAYYKEMRLASRISDVGGAGLGFIDMARKTGNKLEYECQDINSDNYEFFTLQTRINKNFK